MLHEGARLPDDRAIQAPHYVSPPRAKYAGIMAVTTVVAIAAAAGVAAMMGAPSRVVILAAAAVAAGSMATVLPAILKVDRQSWGLVVLGSSMARTMMVLVCALIFDKTRDLGDARTALWIGAMVGAGVVLIVESAVAVRVLAAMDKSASALKVSDTRPAAHA